MALAKNPGKVLNKLGTDKLMPQWDIAAALCTSKAKSDDQQHRDIYPRVHEGISYLEKNGYVKVYKEEKSTRGMPKKMYGLTFKGVMAFLSTVSIKGTAFNVQPEETIEEATQRHLKAKERLQKDFQNTAQFLEFYGELLNYDLFKQASWLLDTYGPVAIYEIVNSAKQSQEVLPSAPSLRLSLFDFFEDFFSQIEKVSEPVTPTVLKVTQRDKEWSDFLRHLRQKYDEKAPLEYSTNPQIPRRRERSWAKRERKVLSEVYPDLFVSLKRLISTFPHKTQGEILIKTRHVLLSRWREGSPDPFAVEDLRNYINTLSQALEKERQKWEEETWRLAFIARFARKFQNSHPRHPERKEDLRNDVLSKFFLQAADDIKRIEVQPSEKLSDIFRGV